jgi:hypothetical protein
MDKRSLRLGLEQWLVFHRQHSQIHRDAAGLCIVIPYWFGWPLFVFMVFWTAFAADSAYQNHGSILRGTTDYLAWSRMYLSGAFVVIGIGVILWMTIAREVVSFRSESFTVCRGVLGIGRCRSFDFVDVHDVRVGSFLDPKARGKWNPSFVRAGIYFEYRRKVYGAQRVHPDL